MDTETMLTTFDNPFDPFDDFVQWFLYDCSRGYNTCGKIARIANWSEELSTIEDKAETERAIDVIVDNDFLNIYKKLVRPINNDQVEEDDEVSDEESAI